MDKHNAQLQTLSGSQSMFRQCLSPGRATGAYSRPPALLKACKGRCALGWRDVHLVEGAGHWVQQEQADVVGKLLLQFLDSQPR